MKEHKLTKDEILKYARLYEERWPNDVALEDKFFDWFRKHRYLNKDIFVRLGRWKTKRQTKNYLRNSDEFIRLTTRKALQKKDEKIKIEILMELYGVSWSVASVILHFAFPNKYPILDFRAIWSLGFEQPKNYNFYFWQQYINRFRKLCEDTNLSARTIDRGLWMFSKLNQNYKKCHGKN